MHSFEDSKLLGTTASLDIEVALLDLRRLQVRSAGV